MRLGNLLLVLTLVLAGCSFGKPEWNGDPQLADKLQVKMSEADVRALMGEPGEIISNEVLGVRQDVWMYYGKEQIGVVFQKDKLVLATRAGRTVVEASVSEL